MRSATAAGPAVLTTSDRNALSMRLGTARLISLVALCLLTVLFLAPQGAAANVRAATGWQFATFPQNANSTLARLGVVTGTITPGGSPLVVTISNPGDTAAITFSGTAGQRVSLNMTNVSISFSYVTILNPDGSTLTGPTAVFSSGKFIDVQTLPATGSYTIQIQPQSSGTGSMTLTLYNVPADLTGAITPSGAAVVPTTTTPGQNASYTFSGTQGQRVSLNITGVSLTSPSGSSPYEIISILKPDGTTLAGSGAVSSIGFIDTQTLPTTGTYTVLVDPQSDAIGTTTLNLYNVPADIVGAIAILGAPVTVTAAVPGHNPTLTFHGEAGQPVVASVSGSTISYSHISFLKPDGTTLDSGSVFTGSGSLGPDTLPVAGTYSLVVDPVLAAIGSMTLTLSPNAPFEPLTQTYGTCSGAGSHAVDPSVCTADPVNSLTGAFTESETDVTLPAPGVSFAFTRSYTSADPTAGRLGPGWTDSYATSLSVQANGDVLLHGDDGQEVYYAKQADGSFVGAPGASSTLASNAGGYKLVRHDQVAYQFNSSGVLQSMLDRNGQGLSFGYDGSGHLTGITDAIGRAITLGYTGNLLTTVSAPGGRTVTYGYTSGRLTTVTLPDPDGGGPLTAPVTTYSYDGGGRLATVLDPNNHTVASNVYDATSGRITQQTDANNKTTTFAWDAPTQTATITDADNNVWKDVYLNNVLIKRIDATGKVTQFGHDNTLDTTAVTAPDNTSTTAMTYDARGNLLTATAPASLGSVQKTFTYDAQNNISTVTDGRGKVSSYGYDAAGNTTSITLDGQQIAGFTYNAQGQVLTSTDGNNKTTTNTYDPNGNLASVTDPLGNKTTYTYDSAGRVLTKVDPLGNCSGCTPANYTTTYTYDTNGHLLTQTDQLGNITTHTYDAAGNQTSVKDANNHTTSYQYDNANHLIQMTGADPDGGGPLTAPITTYSYDSVGNRLTQVDPRGNVSGGNPAAYTTTYTYDADNRVASVTTPKGEKTTYSYDTNGNLASVVDPRGNAQGGNPADYTTSYTYDAAGRLLTTTDPLGNITTNTYDQVGNQATVKDANNHTTSYTYDAAGRILTVTAPDTGVTTYTYDGNGNLKTRTDANSHTTTNTYDDAGHLTQVTGPDPDGGGPLTPPVTTYSYDANGNITSMIDPNGNSTPTVGDGKTTYTYDRGNQLKTVGYSDSTPGVSFSYDAVGNRTAMTDGSGSVSYVYDALNRLTSATRGTNAFSYAYDPTGDVTSRTYPDSTVISYAYDEDNRLSSATTGGVATSYGYDPASHLTQTTLPTGNGYVETRSYDKSGRLTEVKNAKGASVLSDFNTTLDPVGNPTQVVRSGAISTTTTYGYDANDRLTSVCFQSGTCPLGTDPFIRWTYDKVGNRLTEARSSGTTNYTYNAVDELTSAGSTTYTYDQNGNEKTTGSRTFSYDLANRLSSTTSGSTTTTYSYDGDGNRLQASTGTQASKKTNYLWDTNGALPQLALERDGNNALLRRYTYGARRISMTTGAAAYYYNYDPLGSVANLTSSTGATEWTESYEPFGTIRTETKNDSNAPTNLMKFAGELSDPTGLYYLRARQYDPVSGRFLGTDPAATTPLQPPVASYVYVADRPTIMVDPSGMTLISSDAGVRYAAAATSPSNAYWNASNLIAFGGPPQEGMPEEPGEIPLDAAIAGETLGGRALDGLRYLLDFPDNLTGRTWRAVGGALEIEASDAGWVIDSGTYRNGGTWHRLKAPTQSGGSIMYERAGRDKGDGIRYDDWYWKVSPGRGRPVRRIRVGPQG